MPRWLRALVDEGLSVEEFLIGASWKRSAAAKKEETKKKGAKPVRKPRRPKDSEAKTEPKGE